MAFKEGGIWSTELGRFLTEADLRPTAEEIGEVAQPLVDLEVAAREDDVARLDAALAGKLDENAPTGVGYLTLRPDADGYAGFYFDGGGDSYSEWVASGSGGSIAMGFGGYFVGIYAESATVDLFSNGGVYGPPKVNLTSEQGTASLSLDETGPVPSNGVRPLTVNGKRIATTDDLSGLAGTIAAVSPTVAASTGTFALPGTGETFSVNLSVPGVTTWKVDRPSSANGRHHVRLIVGTIGATSLAFTGVITPRGVPFVASYASAGSWPVELVYVAAYGLWVAVDKDFNPDAVFPGIASAVQRASRVDGVGAFDATFAGAAGEAPDPTKWMVGVGRSTIGGGLQEYVPEAAALDGAGNLRIKLTREATPDGDADPARQFTSGQILSRRRFEPGCRISAEIKLPVFANGAIGVFYTLGVDNSEEFLFNNPGSSRTAVRYPAFPLWPKSGEIDIVEADIPNGEVAHVVNVATAESLVGALPGVPTYFAGYGDPTYDRTQVQGPATASSAFHEYAVEWREEEIVYLIDGVETHRLTAAGQAAAGRDWPFAKHSQFLILQLAVFGPIDPSFTSSEMLVRSVKVTPLTEPGISPKLADPVTWDGGREYKRGEVVRDSGGFSYFLALSDREIVDLDEGDPVVNDDPEWLPLGLSQFGLEQFSGALASISGTVASVEEAASELIDVRMPAVEGRVTILENAPTGGGLPIGVRQKPGSSGTNIVCAGGQPGGAFGKQIGSVAAVPVLIGNTVKVDAVSCIVQNGVPGAKHRLGLYRDDGAHGPGLLIFDAGEVDASEGNAVKMALVPGGPVTLEPGIYWLAHLFAGTGEGSSVYGTGFVPWLMPSQGNVNYGVGYSWSYHTVGQPLVSDFRDYPGGGRYPSDTGACMYLRTAA